MQLREFRKQQGLSAAEMGRRLGVSHTTVIRWETGAIVPGGIMLRRIAQETGGAVTPNDMVLEYSTERTPRTREDAA